MKLFVKDKEEVKGGKKVTYYKINPELQDKIELKILAINIDTGAIDYRPVYSFSKHENLRMYKISTKLKTFEPFWASEDHSIIAYDRYLDSIRKITPIELMNDYNVRYYLIQYNINHKKFLHIEVNETDTVKKLLNQNCLLIPSNVIEVKYDADMHYAYDFTVDEYYTFATHDGVFVQDTAGIYFIDSEEARKEIFTNKVHCIHYIKYPQNDKYIHIFRHEALYALYILSIQKINNIKPPLTIESLKEYKLEFSHFNDIDRPVFVKELNETYPLGLIILNKIFFDDKILVTIPITKKNVDIINDILYKKLKNENKHLNEFELNKLYLDKLHEAFLKISDFITYSKYTVTIEDVDYTLYPDITEKINVLPDEPYIGKVLYDKIADEALEKLKEDNSTLYNFYISGARASKTQISQIVVGRGYIADDKNIIIKQPIRTNLLQGLSEEELFISSYGARKGIIDKHEQTPQSGYLSRTMIMNTSFVTVDDKVDDCGTERYLAVEVKNNEKIVKSLIDRYYLNPDTYKLEKITIENYKDIANNFDVIYVRSPIYCRNKKFKICKKCAGNFKFRNLGLHSGAYIAERMTQLILRTFHTSGAAILDIPDELRNNIDIEDIIGINKIRPEKVKLYRELIDKYINPNNNYKVMISDDGQIISNGILINKDIVTTVYKIKKLLVKTLPVFSSNSSVPLYPDVVYKMIMSEYLKHGFIKSLYIETIISILYVELVNDEDQIKAIPIKYIDDINWNRVTKLSIKSVGKYFGKILHLIYEPNKNSIFNLIERKDDNIDIDDIYFRLFGIYE